MSGDSSVDQQLADIDRDGEVEASLPTWACSDASPPGKRRLTGAHGRITESYLRQARRHVSKDGLIIFSICNNSAYEVMDAIDLDYSVVGFELGFSGFWRAIVGARI